MAKGLHTFKREGRVRLEDRIGWYLYGPAGVMQFVLLHIHEPLTGLHTEIEFEGQWYMAMGIDYHSPVPHFEDQEPRDCPFLDGLPCYFDGTSLGALELMNKWKAAGFDDEIIWSTLTGYYWAWVVGEKVFPDDDE